MADTVTPEVRSRMMSAIKGRNTVPELQIRRGLHAMGFRYGLHSRRFPGRPDLILPKYKAVIWIHGCYWHGHECGSGRLPKSNEGYWTPKITRNKERDGRNTAAVEAAGWRSLVVWECCLRRTGAAGLTATLAAVADWLSGNKGSAELNGRSVRD